MNNKRFPVSTSTAATIASAIVLLLAACGDSTPEITTSVSPARPACEAAVQSASEWYEAYQEDKFDDSVRSGWASARQTVRAECQYPGFVMAAEAAGFKSSEILPVSGSGGYASWADSVRQLCNDHSDGSTERLCTDFRSSPDGGPDYFSDDREPFFRR